MTRLFVKANAQGEILSVAKVDSLPQGIDSPFGADEPDTVAVEISHADEFLNLQPIEIHEGYTLDVAGRRLLKKT